jgi:hypothetical protein
MKVFVVIQKNDVEFFCDGKIMGVFYKVSDALNFINELNKDQYGTNFNSAFSYQESTIS